MTNIKNVVLVHGAFADGSGWEAVANILKNDGYKVSVAQPPETSYADDQKYTKAVIDAMDGPVVLVGHSYGGSIITEAGNHPKVAALVYIAAFALDEGESCASIEQALPYYGIHIAIVLSALLAMALVAVSIFLCYGFADRLARIFGKTAMTVIVRLSSFLLLCIGVQIIWNGFSALLATLHFANVGSFLFGSLL